MIKKWLLDHFEMLIDSAMCSRRFVADEVPSEFARPEANGRGR